MPFFPNYGVSFLFYVYPLESKNHVVYLERNDTLVCVTGGLKDSNALFQVETNNKMNS